MILDEIANKTIIRVEEAKKRISLDEMKAKAKAMNSDTGYPFYKALQKEGISFICEVKKASPSKGIIAKDFPYIDIAKSYEEGGASAISVLTEPYYFLGSDEYLKEIKKNVSIPVLRKDFTVDEYQIYEAKVIGADAVLLICSLLDKERLNKYLKICKELGLSALVEAHTEEEIDKAVSLGAQIIGVNNRNLKDFTVDFDNCKRLKSMIPQDVIYVAESGVSSVEDVRSLKEANVDAVLMGEFLMRSTDRVKTLTELRQI